MIQTEPEQSQIAYKMILTSIIVKSLYQNHTL